MNEVNFTSTSNNIRVKLDPDILEQLIFGDLGPDQIQQLSSQDRSEAERNASLREYQVYRLMRGVVSELNSKLRARRERFKLVEEGDGLTLEYQLS